MNKFNLARNCKMGLLIVVLSLWLSAIPIQAHAQEQVQTQAHWTDHPFIAHALGGIDNYTYTNSYEAFIENYQKGHRVFEADLILTEDGHLVARHDWRVEMAEILEQEIPENRLGMPWTLEEFQNTRILDEKYTPITFEDIAKLMSRYKDMYIVTDTKDKEQDMITQQFQAIIDTADRIDPSILERIIPQIYNQEMYGYVQEVWPFPEVIYSLYMSLDTNDQVIDFAKKNGIKIIAMPTERAQHEFVTHLKENGILSYVHTVNEFTQIEAYKAIGVHGFYTDFITTDTLNEYEASLSESEGSLDPNADIHFMEETTPDIMDPAINYPVFLTVMNNSQSTWDKDEVFLSYHWLDSNGDVVQYDGVRTAFPQDVPPGTRLSVKADVRPPDQTGSYILQWDLVHETVTWFSQLHPDNAKNVPVQVDILYSAEYQLMEQFSHISTPTKVRLQVKNTGKAALNSDQYLLAYHWLDTDGKLVELDGIRTPLPNTIMPGDSIEIIAKINPPIKSGDYYLQFDLVQEGVAWLSNYHKNSQYKGTPVYAYPIWLSYVLRGLYVVLPLALLAGIIYLYKRKYGHYPSFLRAFAKKSIHVFIQLLGGLYKHYLALWFLLSLMLKIQWVEKLLMVQTDKGTTLLSFAILMLVTLLIEWISRKKWVRAFVFLTVHTFLACLLLSDIVYNSYFNDVISASVLLYASQLSSLGGSITELIQIKHVLILFVDILFMTVLIIISNRLRNLKQVAVSAEHHNLILRRFALWIVLPLTLYPLVTQTVKIIEDDGRVYTQFFYNKLLVEKLGLINYHLFNTTVILKEEIFKPKPTEEELVNMSEWFTNHIPVSSDSPSFGTAANLNLIVVQLESVQNFVIGLKINGEEVTPNLNNLVKNSYYFSNYFDQTFQGRTSDGEFTSLVSQYPLSSGSIYTSYFQNSFEALPKILSEYGYSTFSAHAYRGDFWNRQQMHQSLGFQSSLFEEDLAEDEHVGWGLGDQQFFDQMVEKITELPEPFMSFLITLSNHHPYNSLPQEYKQLPLKQLEGTLLGNYLNSVRYTDMAVGKLIERLERKGLSDQTVLAFYGDHDAGIPFGDVANLLNINPTPLNELLTDKVPLIVHVPNQKGAEIQTVGGHLDFTPTMLDLLGIDPEFAPFMGSSLLNPPEGKLVISRDGSLVTQENVYVQSICYNLERGSAVETGLCKNQISEAEEIVKWSDQIIKGDLMHELEFRMK